MLAVSLRSMNQRFWSNFDVHDKMLLFLADKVLLSCRVDSEERIVKNALISVFRLDFRRAVSPAY